MEQVTQGYMSALNSNVNQFRMDKSFCDVEIHVEGSVFKCHRLILAAATKYFRIVFSPGKFAPKVTLKEVEADTFKSILGFIYTGTVSVNHANLFKLIRASDFFKLDAVGEFCSMFIQKNMNTPIEDGLEIFSYVRVTGKTKINEIIGQNIYKNFEYFSTTPKFLEMSFEEFTAILNLTFSSTSDEAQDKFMYAIMRWTRHTERSPQDRSHFYQLFKRINLAKLSTDCISDLVCTSHEDFFMLSRARSYQDVVDSEVKEVVDLSRLFVYVNYYMNSGEATDHVTKVFNLNAQCNQPKWINSFRYDGSNFFSNNVRTIVMEDVRRLYRLSYSTVSYSSIKQQEFKTCSFIPFSSSLSLCLKPPPLIMEQYEMCGLGKHIYVYNRNTSRVIPSDPNDTTFRYDELTRGIFFYNQEVDTWLSLPSPKPVLTDACMTCDDRMVYFIGATNSQNYVQGYDDRTSAWLSLPPTHCAYEGAACCAHQNNIYVSGGRKNPKSLEMFDRVAGKWQNMQPMRYSRSNHRIEPYYLHSKSFLVAAGPSLSLNSDLEVYQVATNQWKPVTSLHQTLLDDSLECKYPGVRKYKVIDMIFHKPCGL